MAHAIFEWVLGIVLLGGGILLVLALVIGGWMRGRDRVRADVALPEILAELKRQQKET